MYDHYRERSADVYNVKHIVHIHDMNTIYNLLLRVGACTRSNNHANYCKSYINLFLCLGIDQEQTRLERNIEPSINI